MNDSQMTFRKLVLLLWGDRWLVVTIISLVVAMGVVYSLTRKPQFESEALLASASGGASQLAALSGLIGQFSGLVGALGVDAGGGESMEETVAVLLSRDFTARFILRHNLLPKLVPELRAEEASPSAGGSDAGEANPVAPVGGIGMERAVERFNRVRTVTVDRRTGFVRFTMRAGTPASARQLAEDMIAEVNAELRTRALRESAASIALLRERMSETPYESIRDAAASLLEAQMKREVMIRSREDFALRVLDPPTLPEERAYPRRKRMVLIAMVLGLMVAAAVSISRGAWRGYKAAH